jgi:Cu/Zn superoxide dismutase
MKHAKKAKIAVAGLLLPLLLLVAACSTSQQTTTGTTTNQTTQANATLSHIPTGTSDLTWNAATQTLTVKMSLNGLAPNSSHIAHIHKGDCSSNGDIIYPLTAITADSKGVGTSETTIPNVQAGIPQSGWYINAHNGGTGLTPDLQKMQIACANIANSNTSTSSDQSVHVTLTGTSAPNQSASGSTQLSIADGKLTVTTTLSGLVPNSTHVAHIHEGSCEAQGKVLYPLNAVVADANGKGTSTTTIDQITSIPSSGWYVTVHLGGTADELSTQTGSDPIACGNITLG